MKHQLILKCAEIFFVHPRDILGHARFGFLIPPRFALYKALRNRGMSMPQIGRMTNRDHSTIRYGLERADYMIERNPVFAERVRILTELKPELAPLPDELKESD